MAPISTILGRNRSQRPDLVFRKFSRCRENFRQTDPDRDQCETDPRPQTGPDRTGSRYRSDGPDEHSDIAIGVDVGAGTEVDNVIDVGGSTSSVRHRWS